MRFNPASHSRCSGLDVDNDSAFINEVLLSYSKKHNLELTRSRAYKKNDQAWIEQKNGAIVRKLRPDPYEEVWPLLLLR